MSLFARLRQIVMVSGVESFGVAVAGITGLLIVNVLPKEQYAVYTFLITCMQLIIGITDLGLSTCALPIVGQRTKDMPWVVGVSHQVFKRRTLLLALAFAVVVPYGAYTFWQHAWLSWAYALAAAFIVVVILVSLRTHYGNNVLLILGHVTTISRVTLLSAITRFLIVGIVLLMPMTAFSVAFVFAATAAAEVASVWMYRRAFKAHTVQAPGLSVDDQKDINRQITKIALPLIPSAIFYHIQGSVTVFLASIFGSANLVAEIGAFGRLAIALQIVDRVAAILLYPAIARTPTGPRLVVRLLQVQGTYLAVMACLLLSAVCLPHYWIVLLGEKYRSMEPFVWMMFLATLLMNAAGSAFLTLAVRGFTQWQAYGIFVVLGAQCSFLALHKVSDLPDLLWFNIVTCGAHFVYQYSMLLFRLRDLGRPGDSENKGVGS